MNLKAALVNRRGIVAALCKEPQEARANLGLIVFRVHPAPGLALKAGENGVEMRTQRRWLGLEPGGPGLVGHGYTAQMHDKLAEKAVQHARLLLDLRARPSRQVQRIVAQERRKPLVLQLEGIGWRRRKGVAYHLSGQQEEALAGAGRVDIARGVGFGFKLAEVFVLERGEFRRLVRILGLPISRKPDPGDGAHCRLVHDLLHGLRRTRQKLGQRFGKARIRMHMRRFPRAMPAAPAIEFGPQPGCAALDRASFAVRRRKEQLLLRRQKAAWRILVEKVAKPAAEAAPRGPLPAPAHACRPCLQVHEPLRRARNPRSLALPAAFIVRHERPPNANFAKVYAKKDASKVVKKPVGISTCAQPSLARIAAAGHAASKLTALAAMLSRFPWKFGLSHH